MQLPLKHPIFKILSGIAAEKGIEAYVIGGYVRDLLLQRPSQDIDIVVHGSGIELAETAARRLGNLRVSVFKNFGTAMFRYKGMEIEFVGARKESYRANSRKPITTSSMTYKIFSPPRIQILAFSPGAPEAC